MINFKFLNDVLLHRLLKCIKQKFDRKNKLVIIDPVITAGCISRDDLTLDMEACQRQVFKCFKNEYKLSAKCFINALKMLVKCFINAFKVRVKCFINAFKMRVKCFINAFKVRVKCFQNAFKMRVKCFINAFMYFAGTRICSVSTPVL